MIKLWDKELSCYQQIFIREKIDYKQQNKQEYREYVDRFYNERFSQDFIDEMDGFNIYEITE